MNKMESKKYHTVDQFQKIQSESVETEKNQHICMTTHSPVLIQAHH